MMKELEIKKKNTAVLDILCKDKSGTALTNLASATAVKFQIKASPDAAAALVEKTLSAGVAVNTPSSGYVRVSLTPTDTTQTVGRYYMALQITWSATEVYEVDIKVDGEKTAFLRIAEEIII